MSESISIGFVIRNSFTGEMLAETPDGPANFVRTATAPSIFPYRGDVLRLMGRLGAHMESIWSWSYNEQVTMSPETRARYIQEHKEWDSFLEDADVVELRAIVRD